MPNFDCERLLMWPSAAPYVFSIMVFPRDQERQEAYYRSLLAAHVAEDAALSDEGLISPDLAKFIYYTPRPKDLLDDRQSEIIDSSVDFVRWALHCVLRSAVDLPEFASIGNAIRAGVKAGAGSSATLKRSWSNYACVAHLWVALSDFNLAPFGRDLKDYPEVFLHFLAIAESVRRMGEAWIPRHARKPVLDSSSTCKVPACVQLPAVNVSFPLSPEQKKNGWLI